MLIKKMMRMMMGVHVGRFGGGGAFREAAVQDSVRAHSGRSPLLFLLLLLPLHHLALILLLILLLLLFPSFSSSSSSCSGRRSWRSRSTRVPPRISGVSETSGAGWERRRREGKECGERAILPPLEPLAPHCYQHCHHCSCQEKSKNN